MAIMDIADIRPLLSAVHDLLADHGILSLPPSIHALQQEMINI